VYSMGKRNKCDLLLLPELLGHLYVERSIPSMI
jgi:hypothetical protein